MSKALKSRFAYSVKGALAMALAPKLAQDAKVDLNAVLSGVTAKTFGKLKPEIGKRLTAATKGKLAADAELSDVVELLDAMERVESEPEDEIAEQPAVDAEGDKGGEVMAFLKDKLSEDDMKRCAELMGGGAADEDEDDAEAKKKAEAEAANKKDEPPAMDAKAVRKLIDDAVSGERNRNDRLREAHDLARPLVGVVAQDATPEDVLRLALDSANVEHEGVSDYVALRALVRAASRRPGTETIVAQDAAGAADWFKKNGIGADRIRA